MVDGPDFLAAPDGSPHPARFDPESRIMPLGEPVGFFPDGWVRAHAVFSVRALDRITSMSLEMWSPPDIEPLSITMKLSDSTGVTLTAPAGRIAVLQFPLDIPAAAERTIELIADQERQLSDRDRRRAAYKLRCIGLY
jgi:hypothetical protein